MPVDMTQPSPSTLEEAITALTSNLHAEEIATIKTSDSITFHHSVGRELRNNWKLWDKNSPLNRHFNERFGLTHGDDVSGIILSGLFAKVRGEDFDPQVQADEYLEHWKKHPA